LGMVAALGLGESQGVTTKGLAARARVLLGRLGLPVDLKAHVSRAVVDRIEVDKKRRSDKVRFVFVPQPGKAELHDIPLDELKQRLLAAV